VLQRLTPLGPRKLNVMVMWQMAIMWIGIFASGGLLVFQRDRVLSIGLILRKNNSDD
jgi:hypothetical protein